MAVSDPAAPSGTRQAHAPLAIMLFGPFQAEVNGRPLARLRSRKAHWLLALLTLRHGREVERSWLAGMLWPDSDEAKALANLRNSLKELRRALGAEAERLHSPTPRTLALELAGAEADVLAFDAAIAAGDGASLERAVALYRGVLLEGCVEEWAFQERQVREQAYLQALETLAAEARARGDAPTAERYLRMAVAVEPTRESAHRALMATLAASGNYAGAILTFRELRQRLHREINAVPGPDTRSLFEQIRAEARRCSKEPRVRASSSLALSLSDDYAVPLTSAGDRPSDMTASGASSISASGVPTDVVRAVLLYKHNAQPDEDLVRALESRLQARGWQVFVDRHMQVSVLWVQGIEQQIRSADAVIPLLSVASVHSELFQLEIELARDAALEQQGRPRLLPVRVQDPGRLPDEIAPIVGSLHQAVWRGPQDDERLVAELIEAWHTVPGPRAALPPPGALPLDSQFYVVRPTDHPFNAAIAERQSLVLVKGARQMGKTSLLARGLQKAREAGFRVVCTDLQRLDPTDLESAEALFKALGSWIAEQLDLDVFPHQVWNPHLGSSVNFARYLRREVLRRMDTHLVWGLDEVDRLFTREFASQVFGLFRSWHNERSLDPTGPWSGLTLAIAYATEAHLFITEIDQSPFNVGTHLMLADFTFAQVADLNGRYGAPLREVSEVERFYRLLGGHPYLVTHALSEMVAQGLTLATLEAEADRDGGIFGDHLRRMLVVLGRNPTMSQIVSGILQGQPCPSEDSFYHLWSAGVVAGESSQDVRPRCQLYAAYLMRHLR